MKQVQVSVLTGMYLKVNKRLEASTVSLTKRAVQCFIDSLGDISDITLAEAEVFQASLIDCGLSRASANIYVKSISPIFTWAVRRGLADQNPFSGLKKFKIARKKVEIFTPHEIERILQSCPNALWTARVMLGLTSLRRGEILALLVSDIDFDRQLIYIQSKKETGFTFRWVPKDHERRVLPLIKPVAKLLLDIYERLPQGQPYLMLKPERYSYLLKNRAKMTDRTRKCLDNNFGRTFGGILKRALVDGNFHMLRKTALTELTSGLRLQEVQEIAGHSSIETTRSYLASRSDLLTRASDILNRGVAQFG